MRGAWAAYIPTKTVEMYAPPVGMTIFSKEIPFQMTPALDLATISFTFINILASSRLSINLCVFINIVGSILFHFLCPFVFIHIVGSTFIFNIFLLGQLPLGLERHIGEPPQLAQAGIFHYLQEYRVFVGRSHQDGVILRWSIDRDAPQAEP